MSGSILKFLSEIQDQFVLSDGFFDLKGEYERISEYSFIVDVESSKFDLSQKIIEDLEETFEFIRMAFPFIGTRPFWCKINIDDQNISQIVGVGFLERFTNWFDFVINYLISDRAFDDGDSKFIIFDLDFKWTLSFHLDIMDSKILVEHFRK